MCIRDRLYTEKLIYEESDKEICPLCDRKYTDTLSPMWYENEDTGEREWRTPESPCNNEEGEAYSRCAITVTGLTPVLHDVSDAVYIQLEKMLPWSLAFVAVTMLILHRNPKVLIICGTPIVMSLAVTFGITVMADIELTPMIIAAGPILIGLGVDYALHLINRIEEGRNERLEEAAEEAWRKQREGLQTEDLEAWDAEVYLGATVDAVMTTGNAIMLSARILGYGKEYKVEVTCGSCGEKEDTPFDLTGYPYKEVDESQFNSDNSFKFISFAYEIGCNNNHHLY